MVSGSFRFGILLLVWLRRRRAECFFQSHRSPRVLVRVYVPAANPNQYFELADMGQGNLLSRGVDAGTLSSNRRQELLITRSLVIKAQKVEDAYDASLSF